MVLFWKTTTNLKIEGSQKYYIDASIDKGIENEWRFTGFYGEPKTTKRCEAWNQLRLLKSRQQVLWLFLGDYNEIIQQHEKVGGVVRPHHQMQLFSDIIDECGFMDLGFVGPKFTWCRHFENGTSIWERLNRGLTTNDWFPKFLGSKVHHLQCDSLDHCPLLVVLAPLDISSRKKPFRFKEMWLSNPGYGEIVQVAWNQGFGVELDREILEKVEKCGKDLIWWNKNVFGSVKQDLV